MRTKGTGVRVTSGEEETECGSSLSLRVRKKKVLPLPRESDCGRTQLFYPLRVGPDLSRILYPT